MFKINGTTVAEPAKEGITVTEEPVWAPNTGRDVNGTMTGDLVAWKRTVAVTWPPLSFTETGNILRAIKNAGPFFSISFSGDTSDVAAAITIRVYASSIPRTIYSLVEGYKRHQGVTITFIEQ
jgi:hypothetical protein